jgi:hypothetical protein
MMLLHFLQRILKTLPLTFSSAIEYFAEHASQTIFMMALDPQAPWPAWQKMLAAEVPQTPAMQAT